MKFHQQNPSINSEKKRECRFSVGRFVKKSRRSREKCKIRVGWVKEKKGKDFIKLYRFEAIMENLEWPPTVSLLLPAVAVLSINNGHNEIPLTWRWGANDVRATKFRYRRVRKPFYRMWKILPPGGHDGIHLPPRSSSTSLIALATSRFFTILLLTRLYA